MFKKKPDQAAVHQVYLSIVAQSRQKIFYADWEIPDSVTGRFDMIAIHLCLIFRRLKTSEDADRQFSQDLFDWFFKDMDRSLREMGVGDTGIAKRVQKMGELLYGMLASIGDALDKQDEQALYGALSRNIYAGQDCDSIKLMVQYVMNFEQDLKQQQNTSILSGVLTMKAPA